MAVDVKIGARYTAIAALFEGLTLTDAGLANSPVSLSGTVEDVDDLPLEVARGTVVVYIHHVQGSAAEYGIQHGHRDMWRVQVNVPLTGASSDWPTARYAVMDAIANALGPSTLSGTAPRLDYTLDSSINRESRMLTVETLIETSMMAV